MGNDNFTAAPSGTFRTADGHINIAANKQEQWKRCATCSSFPSSRPTRALKSATRASATARSSRRCSRRSSPGSLRCTGSRPSTHGRSQRRDPQPQGGAAPAADRSPRHAAQGRRAAGRRDRGARHDRAVRPHLDGGDRAAAAARPAQRGDPRPAGYSRAELVELEKKAVIGKTVEGASHGHDSRREDPGAAAGLSAVKAMDVVEPRVDLAMSHENATLVINQFKEIYEGTGREAKPWDPGRIAIIFDHRVPAEGPKTASNHRLVRGFVAQHGIAKFHDIRGDRGGICHQVLPEFGYVRPGSVVSAPTATRRATARSARFRSASGRPRWRRSGRSGSPSTSRCRRRSRSSSRAPSPSTSGPRT